jgi:four helix bundle protein
MGARTFQELAVFQKAHRWVLDTYRTCRTFPRDELFGLTAQLKRAAVSLPANMAEGFVKRGKADKLRFYNIAQGSLEECRYYLILTRDLEFAETTELMTALDEVSRMLEAYIRAVRGNGFSARFLWLLAPGFWLLPKGTL